MLKSYEFLQFVGRTCSLGQVFEEVLAKTGAKIGKVLTYDVKKGSDLHRRIPELFKGIENPRLQYGYENTKELNSYFINIMDGNNIQRVVKYKKAGGIYNAEISSATEHLNCVFKPDVPLINLSKSAFRVNTGVKGTPENMLDVLVNLNDSALRIEGRVAKTRFGRTINRYLPSSGRIGLQSGVEGTPVGRTDIGLNYHGSDVNLELKNEHLERLRNLLQ